jgi:peptidoglycan hydrolase-like protein with peptidoglycan-binding domain
MVRKYQEMLVHLGFLATADTGAGIIGNETTAAIKAFQRASSIGVDGLIGPDTQRALQTAIARSPAPASTTTFPAVTQPADNGVVPPPPPEDGKMTDEPWFWAVAAVGGFAVAAFVVRGLR